MTRPTPAAVAAAMEMQRPMETPVHKNIFAALAAAQAEFSAPKKDAVNPAFRSKYADLASVVAAVAPALSKHGIGFGHYMDGRDFGQGVEACMVTALVHGESETRFECAIPLIVNKRDMQGLKSATTYAKRIGLESVTGVAPDDDDGNDAAKNPPTRQTVPNEAMETQDGLISSRKADPYPQGATPAQRARIAADGIIKEMNEVKTADGLEGVWTRNDGLIKRFQQTYPTEYRDVVSAYDTAAYRFRPVEE